MELFIVTFHRDFPYLEWCLKSINKFAVGFSGVTIAVPNEDIDSLQWMIESLNIKANTIGYEDWPGKGMLRHEHVICSADEFIPQAEHIAHLDSDCIFTESVSPGDYLDNNKPILLYEDFNILGRTFPEVLRWQRCTQDCLPFPVLYETMRQHPEVYHRDTYSMARKAIKEKTGKDAAEYIREQRNEFPQTFCEFVTLGNVAIQYNPERYSLWNIQKRGWPKSKLQQFWSHGDIDKPQNIWWHGVQQEIVPLEACKKIIG